MSDDNVKPFQRKEIIDEQIEDDFIDPEDPGGDPDEGETTESDEELPLAAESKEKPKGDDDEEDGEAAIQGYVDKLKAIPDKQWTGWMQKLMKIDDARAALNDQAAKVREDAKKAGIKATDLNAVYARYKMDPIERKKRDAAIQRGNKAMKEQTMFDFN